jgi:hypothetical protein
MSEKEHPCCEALEEIYVHATALQRMTREVPLSIRDPFSNDLQAILAICRRHMGERGDLA